MPDISMCPSPDCPLRRDCFRNEASGTRPKPDWQSYIAFSWQALPEGAGAICDGYWPRRDSTAYQHSEPDHADA